MWISLPLIACADAARRRSACLSGVSLLWATLIAVALVSLGRGQDPGQQAYRAYPLLHRRAAEVAPQVRNMLSGVAGESEVLVDDQRNRLLVEGGSESQRVAAQLIQALDQPAVAMPVPAAGGEPVSVESYAVAGPLDDAVARVRARFGQASGVRIATDSRTGRLIVAAPAPLQQQVSQFLSEPKPPIQPPPATFPRRDAAQPANAPLVPTPIPTPAAIVEPHPLMHVSAAAFEHHLQSLLGGKMRTVGDAIESPATVLMATAEGVRPVLRIHRREDRVEFVPGAPGGAAWQRLVAAMDAPQTDASRQTQMVSLQNADPANVRYAVTLLNDASRQSNGSTAAVAVAGSTREVRWGGDLLAMIFQQDGQPLESPPDQPDDAQRPADANAPAADPAAVDDAGGDGGLIGPVQIEFIEGLDVIVIRGRQRDVERVQRIIAEIEQISAETQPVIEVYPLKHVNDEALVALIDELYEEVLESRQGQVSILPLIVPNAILLIGREESLAFVKQLIEKLDQPAEPLDEFVIMNLSFASALDAEQTIRNFFVNQPGTDNQPLGGLGTRVRVIADYRTNSLIVRASPRDLEQIKRLVENLDVEHAATKFELRVFRLRNALAPDLAETLLGAIRGESTTTGQPAGGPGAIPGQGGGGAQTQSGTSLPAASLEFHTIDQGTGELLRSGIMDDVQVTADANINALIVRAPPESMELLTALIQELDQIPDAEAVIKVFTIVNGDATNLATMLQQLFGQAVTVGQGNAQFPFAFGQTAQPQLTTAGEGSLVPLTFAVDVRTNSIIASGGTNDLVVVETLLLRLDESDIATRKLTVVRLKNAPALDVANSITTFLTSQRQLIQQQLLFNQAISPFEQIEREVIVVPEVVTNSLIVSATPRYYDEILQVIKDLDFRPAMVMVQVIIAEVRVGSGFEFGTEFGLQSSLLFDRGVAAATPASQLTPGFNFIEGDPGLPNLTPASPGSVGGQGISTLGLGRMSNLSNVSYGGMVLSAASDSVAALVRALEQQDKLQVIARPQVMALNNQEAFVQVGADVARITGTTTTNAAVQQNVEDVPTGLILRVQPLINDDGVVVMRIDAERSRLGPITDGTVIGVIDTATGTEPLIIQPIERTTAQTTISAKSGQTVVFAGLITDSKRAETRGIPWLSSVPVLGRLFRYDAEETERTELLIIMTPHIIDDDEDYEMVKLLESQRMTWCLSDIIAMHGDVGLAGGPCLFCEDGIPMLYPDADPTAASLTYPPLMSDTPMPAGAVPSPTPMHETSSRRNAMPKQLPSSAHIDPARFRPTVEPDPTLRLPMAADAPKRLPVPSLDEDGSDSRVQPAGFQGGPTR